MWSHRDHANIQRSTKTPLLHNLSPSEKQINSDSASKWHSPKFSRRAEISRLSCKTLAHLRAWRGKKNLRPLLSHACGARHDAEWKRDRWPNYRARRKWRGRFIHRYIVRLPAYDFFMYIESAYMIYYVYTIALACSARVSSGYNRLFSLARSECYIAPRQTDK